MKDNSQPLAVCAIFAHPDDESFGVAGTFAECQAREVATALICTTRGEAGMTNGLAEDPAALAALRIHELSCASQVMGVSDLIVYEYPDGSGDSWDRAALAAQIELELRRLAPAVVITFDPGGVTLHPDHIAVHQTTYDVVTRRGADLGVRRLYYLVVTCESEASPEGPSLACVPLEAVDLSVDISKFEPVKRAALACHRTQADDTARLLGQPPGSLCTEHYQLAWSVDGWRPRPGETDLLAGL